MLFLLQMLLGVAILAAAVVPFLPAARAEANVGVPIYTPTLTALPPTLGVLQEAIQREARHFSTVDVCGDAVCDQMVRQANGLARLKTIRKYIVEAVRFSGAALLPFVFCLFCFCLLVLLVLVSWLQMAQLIPRTYMHMLINLSVHMIYRTIFVHM